MKFLVQSFGGNITILMCLCMISFISCTILKPYKTMNPLSGKIICIDPGHGGTASFDNYRVGLGGEREEWIDLRVALILKDLLEAKGAKVLLTRTDDIQVDLKERALLATNNRADVFISIHHNATADCNVNFPIIYYHANASENQASVQLGKFVAHRISEALFSGKTPVSLVSDHTIFPESGTAVLRYSYGIPGIIGEASFFSNPEEERRLKDREYNLKEAQAYLKALEDFFSSKPLPIIVAVGFIRPIKPFQVLQEAERMDESAKNWQEDYIEGKRVFEKGDTDSLQKAYELFSRSAKSFPDSFLAGECHLFRARILERLGKKKEAEDEFRRVKEYYVKIK